MSNRDLPRYALLASGSGSTAEVIIRSCLEEAGVLNGLITPACLIASKPGIGAIERAISAGIPMEHIYVIDPKDYHSQEEFGEAILKVFSLEGINVFGQHGWLPLTPENVISSYSGINQHPGPLPHFGGKGMYGRRVHSAVLHFRRLAKRDVFWTEAISQMVATEFDKGLVLIRQQVPIFPSDTVETLRLRVLPIEHLVQILALVKLVAYNFFPEELPPPLMPLVFASELPCLEEAKKLAIADYPNG